MSTVYNKALFEFAHERMSLAPLELTEGFRSAREPSIRPSRRRPVRQCGWPNWRLCSSTRQVQTKAASPDDRSRRPVTRKQLAAFAEKFGTFLIEMVAKNVVAVAGRGHGTQGARAGTRSRGGGARRGMPC